MQIHELNNFTGTLGSGAYLAIDDGTDTGKISSQGLLAATEARIDNIIAGPAPSAEEIVDARLGADGVTYPSLGDAIRDQVTDVKSAINDTQETTDNLFFMTDPHDSYNNVTADIQPDGSYVFNGTASASTNFVVMGATVRTQAILPAGIYSFGFEKVSGTCSASNNDFSLRVGGTSSSNAMVGPWRGSKEDITFDSDAVATIYVKSGTVLTNYRVKIWINSGSTLKSYKPHKAVVDYIARENVDAITPYANLIKNANEKMTLKYPLLLETSPYRGQGGTLIVGDGGNQMAWIRNPSSGQTEGDVRYCNIYTGVSRGSNPSHSGITDTNIGHANDVCFCPDDDCLYVATMLESGAIAKLTGADWAVYDSAIYPVDGDGHTFVSYAIAYDRTRNQFILNTNQDKFHVYDSSWNYVKTINIEHWTNGLVATQGMETDGTYIYLIIEGTNGDKYPSYIVTYDMDGNIVEEFYLKEFSDSELGIEIEGIAYDWTNGFFIANCNIHSIGNTQYLYAIVPNSMNYHCVGLTSLMIRRWMNGATF